ncbi:SDR family NAD(P)-dependent oxidoreductase [Xanthobacter autotrophicus]|uniref:SDR family NAD(P)-dependent oxidoreductase n=1 Tax=Xanthobacter autotrophicus TaxID=280 RepID=UPI0037287983
MNASLPTLAPAGTALLSNQVCMIIGAASPRGIGHATARLFAEHGAKIAVVDVAMDDAVREDIRKTIGDGLEANIIGVKCDIQNPVDCDRAVSEVLREFGGLDCMVNCAGLVRSQGMLSISEADYDLVLGVNLKGTFNICKSALNVFKEKGRGSIINLASVAAQRGGGLVGGAHYAASKGGVVSLTRTIAREFGPIGIRANVVCPSMIETSMLDGLSPERYREIVANVPLQRAGHPLDVAGACLFLASGLSAYVTGATIDVNGGSHIH